MIKVIVGGLSAILILLLFVYYIFVWLDGRQDEPETKKQYLMGLIPGYWWYKDFLAWLENLKKKWNKLS